MQSSSIPSTSPASFIKSKRSIKLYVKLNISGAEVIFEDIANLINLDLSALNNSKPFIITPSQTVGYFLSKTELLEKLQKMDFAYKDLIICITPPKSWSVGRVDDNMIVVADSPLTAANIQRIYVYRGANKTQDHSKNTNNNAISNSLRKHLITNRADDCLLSSSCISAKSILNGAPTNSQTHKPEPVYERKANPRFSIFAGFVSNLNPGNEDRKLRRKTMPLPLPYKAI